MKTVVFIDAPTTPEQRLGGFAKVIPLKQDRPHIGILTLAAVTRRAGYRTYVIDPYPYGWGNREIVSELKGMCPNVIGISAQTLGIINAGGLADAIKQTFPDVPIIIGGQHVTALSERTMQLFGSFDFGCIGEGEETILELLDIIFEDKNAADVLGIAYRDGDSILVTPRRPYIKDLDSLPFPAWDLLPHYPENFFPFTGGSRKRPIGSLFSTRGCPWKCIFCDRAVFGEEMRSFSAEYVMEMVKILYERHGIREIMFADDTMLAFRERTLEFAELLARANMNLRWECMARVIDADSELYTALKKSGCFEISFGIESASEKVSTTACKHLTREMIDRAVSITKEAGIRVRGYFIFGLPGETKETLRESVDYILNGTLDDVAIFSCTPHPGSWLYGQTKKYGSFDEKWDKMNHLSTLFVPHNLKAEEIDNARLNTLKKFYLRPRYIYRSMQRMVREGSYSELFLRGMGYVKVLGNLLKSEMASLGRGA